MFTSIEGCCGGSRPEGRVSEVRAHLASVLARRLISDRIARVVLLESVIHSSSLVLRGSSAHRQSGCRSCFRIGHGLVFFFCPHRSSNFCFDFLHVTVAAVMLLLPLVLSTEPFGMLEAPLLGLLPLVRTAKRSHRHCSNMFFKTHATGEANKWRTRGCGRSSSSVADTPNLSWPHRWLTLLKLCGCTLEALAMVRTFDGSTVFPVSGFDTKTLSTPSSGSTCAKRPRSSETPSPFSALLDDDEDEEALPAEQKTPLNLGGPRPGGTTVGGSTREDTKRKSA